MEGINRKTVKSLEQHLHERVFELHAQGLKNVEIARTIGYTPTHITYLLKHSARERELANVR
jgi:hypothetical protein